MRMGGRRTHARANLRGHYGHLYVYGARGLLWDLIDHVFFSVLSPQARAPDTDACNYCTYDVKVTSCKYNTIHN